MYGQYIGRGRTSEEEGRGAGREGGEGAGGGREEEGGGGREEGEL